MGQRQESLSDFTGGAIANGLYNFATLLVSLITLGLAYPFMVCRKLRWELSHTYLDGRQLVFDGKGGQLLGKYILWLLLSLITLGIYFLTAGRMKLIAWKTEHTHFADAEDLDERGESEFTGKWYQLMGVKFVANLVTVITLTLGMYWAHCYVERWYAKHKIIDGYSLVFDGKGGQYFGKCLAWNLLTVITLGIFALWRAVKAMKWNIKHTHVVGLNSEEQNSLSVSVGVETGQKNYAQTGEIKLNSLAIAGFICVMSGWCGFIGLILSIIGLARAKEYGNGKGFGIAGIVIGIINTVLSIAWINIIINLILVIVENGFPYA